MAGIEVDSMAHIATPDGTERMVLAAGATGAGATPAKTTLAELAAYVNGSSLAPAAEWAPNFTGAGDLYIPAVDAMTVDQGNATIGTGTLAYAKSTAAAPSTFTTTALPVTLEPGAWLRVTASAVTGFVATHLRRTA